MGGWTSLNGLRCLSACQAAPGSPYPPRAEPRAACTRHTQAGLFCIDTPDTAGQGPWGLSPQSQPACCPSRPSLWSVSLRSYWRADSSIVCSLGRGQGSEAGGHDGGSHPAPLPRWREGARAVLGPLRLPGRAHAHPARQPAVHHPGQGALPGSRAACLSGSVWCCGTVRELLSARGISNCKLSRHLFIMGVQAGPGVSPSMAAHLTFVLHSLIATRACGQRSSGLSCGPRDATVAPAWQLGALAPAVPRPRSQGLGVCQSGSGTCSTCMPGTSKACAAAQPGRLARAST